MKATIYAGRHQLYFDQKARIVDTFQGVLSNGRLLIVNAHLCPESDDYETCGKNMADLLAGRGTECFEIINSYLYDSARGQVIKAESVDGMRSSIRGVSKDSLVSFRRGLLSKLRGAIA